MRRAPLLPLRTAVLVRPKLLKVERTNVLRYFRINAVIVACKLLGVDAKGKRTMMEKEDCKDYCL